MTASLFFSTFCQSLVLDDAHLRQLDQLTATVILPLNTTFRAIRSGKGNALPIGALGRHTSLPSSRQVDLLYQMPWNIFDHYKQRQNGPQLFQANVLELLNRNFSRVTANADGSILLDLEGGYRARLIAAFELGINGTYCHPAPAESKWLTIQPDAELQAFSNCDSACNGNLRDLARLMHAWRDAQRVPLDDDQIDALAYHFIQQWEFRGHSHAYYGWMCSDFFRWMESLATCSGRIHAPCNRRIIRFESLFLSEAQQARRQVTEASTLMGNGNTQAGSRIFSQLFGQGFLDSLHRQDEQEIALFAQRMLAAH